MRFSEKIFWLGGGGGGIKNLVIFFFFFFFLGGGGGEGVVGSPLKTISGVILGSFFKVRIFSGMC